MSNKRNTKFEFTGNPQPHVETVDGEPVTRVVSPAQPSMQVGDTQVHLETAVQDGLFASIRDGLRQLFERIVAEWRQAKLTVTLALVAGTVFGLTVLGWYWFPVQWTNYTYAELSPAHRQAIIDMATDLYAKDQMNPNVIRFVYLYPDLQDDTCDLAQTATDPAVRDRRRALAYKVSGQDCLFGQ